MVLWIGRVKKPSDKTFLRFSSFPCTEEMATVSAFSALPSICSPNSTTIPSYSPIQLLPFIPRRRRFQTHVLVSNSFNNRLTFKESHFRGIKKLRAGEEETQIPEEEKEPQEASELQEQAEQQMVSVPVSPSDTLTMFFEAEGTMSEAAIPTVTRALEGTEGVTDLKVKVLEGIASVELKKQTTVQATGVASSLVELIQGSGFKLQTLNLSFEDEEDFVFVA